jgi:hypothetical protein
MALCGSWLDPDGISHTANTGQAADDPLGLIFLEVEFDLALQRDPAARHHHLQVIKRRRVMRLQSARSGAPVRSRHRGNVYRACVSSGLVLSIP